MKNPRLTTDHISVEPLEQRMMLSTVEIFAAGSSGNELFELLVDDQSVATFQARDHAPLFFDGTTDRFVFETEETLDPSQLSIVFTNGFTSSQGDFNQLLVDKIIVDGEVIETESPDTLLDRPTQFDGFFETEVISGTRGRFDFRQDISGQPLQTRIRIDAIGETGEENL